MADAEGEKPDFDELEPLGEGGQENELLEEALGPDDRGASEQEPVEAVAAEEEAEGEEAGNEKEEEEAPEKTEKKEKRDKPGADLLAAVAKTSPYTVMLGLALLAILIAIFCLFMEMRSYDFDRRASDYRQRASLGPGLQSPPAIATAAAWPADVQLTSKATGADEPSGSRQIT